MLVTVVIVGVMYICYDVITVRLLLLLMMMMT